MARRYEPERVDGAGAIRERRAQVRNTVEFLPSLTHQVVQRGSIGQDDPFYYHLYGATQSIRDLRLSAPEILT